MTIYNSDALYVREESSVTSGSQSREEEKEEHLQKEVQINIMTKG